MKYDPVSLFEIVVLKVKDEEDYSLDIAPSKDLIKYCAESLNKTQQTGDVGSLSPDEAYKILAAAIIEYAFKPERKN